jgi:hypothetical protein
MVRRDLEIRLHAIESENLDLKEQLEQARTATLNP